MAELPIVIITEILSLLPVKPLMRFLCVSKQFYSVIKDPHFVKLHLKNSIQNNTNQTLIIRNSDLHSLDFPNLTKLTLITHPLNPGGEGTEFLGSSNGIICLSNGLEEDAIFYNPATREHHKLPASEVEFASDKFGWCERSVYGFGYDAVNDDYKLVRVVQFNGYDEFDSEVKVYSLKSCSWRRIRGFPRKYYLLHKRCWGVLVNGGLHWIVSRKPESDGRKFIVCFDIGTEEYKIVSQPKYADGEFHMNLGVLGGDLYMLCNYDGVKSDVWVMKEYGVEKSWFKLFSVEFDGVVEFFSEYMRPIAYSNDGLSVLVEKDGNRMFWFDLKTQTVKNDVVVSGLPCVSEAELVVESLVPLKCHKSEIKKVQPKRKEKKSKSKPKRLGRTPTDWSPTHLTSFVASARSKKPL